MILIKTQIFTQKLWFGYEFLLLLKIEMKKINVVIPNKLSFMSG